MIRTLGWVIWLFGYFISRLPVYWRAKSLAKQGRLAERDAIIGNAVEVWSKKLLHHIKMDVEVIGAENLPGSDIPVVFACNHQSFLDIPVVLGCIHPPHPLLARQEIGQVPLLGLFMRQLGCVFMSRGDVRANVAALKDCEALLKDGKSLFIFPEGTRAKSDAVAAFQPGAVRVAWKAGVPIVPVAIDGTYRGLEGNGYKVQKTSVRLFILPMVETRGLDKAARSELPTRLEGMIREAKKAR